MPSWAPLLEQFMVSKQSSIKALYARQGLIDDVFWRAMLGNLIISEFPVSVPSEADRVAYESLQDMVINQASFITMGRYIGIGP
jgi:hypothetical protein